MSDAPTFTVAPCPRCSHVDGERALGYCGAPATWGELADDGLALAFFCDVHRTLFAQRLPDSFLCRRVSVTTQVFLTGVCPEPGVAELEASMRVAALLSSAGALVGIQTANSVIGLSSTAQQARTAMFSGGGRGNYGPRVDLAGFAKR